MWVPLGKKKKTQTKLKSLAAGEDKEERRSLFLIFFSILFIIRFTKICPSEFVGINTGSALRDEGYA